MVSVFGWPNLSFSQFLQHPAWEVDKKKHKIWIQHFRNYFAIWCNLVPRAYGWCDDHDVHRISRVRFSTRAVFRYSCLVNLINYLTTAAQCKCRNILYKWLVNFFATILQDGARYGISCTELVTWVSPRKFLRSFFAVLALRIIWRLSI